MIFILHSETDESQIASRIGESEYSYYFVLSAFRPMLDELGTVIVVKDPASEVDPIYHAAVARGEDCIFLSFAPPHRTTLGLSCPTIPVFAWEFDTIPHETWFCEREQDWRFVLNQLGRAITHSSGTIGTVRRAMGADFPITSIPAPVWDSFAALGRSHPPKPVAHTTVLPLTGLVIDSRTFDLSPYDRVEWTKVGVLPPAPEAGDPQARTDVVLDGVVYISIFNPSDSRKNWDDLMGGFCWALREAEDATLLLKLNHYDCSEPLAWMLEHLNRHRPFKCRVLIQNGYLDAEAYERLVTAQTYAVNTSHGEGQCLPLMEAMACGKPALAPRHTGMADYLDESNAFLIRSSAEPTGWPQDPRHAYRTLRQRIDLESVVSAYRESYRIAKEEPGTYARMGENAHEAMRRHCSRAGAAERLTAFLKQPARPPEAGRDYGRIKPRFDAPWIIETVTADAS